MMENAAAQGTYRTGPQGSATVTSGSGSTRVAASDSRQGKALPRLKLKLPKPKKA